MSDYAIIITIIAIFLAVGAFLPFVSDELGETVSSPNIEQIEENLGGQIDNETVVGGFDILLSILSMFFWTFGALPLAVDSFFILLRIALVIFIVRTVRGTG